MTGPAVIDMVGVRVGTRVVIERAPRTTDVKTPGARWLVRCDCGATAIVRGSVLRRATRGLTCVECQARDHTNDEPSYATLHSRLVRTRGNADSHVCVVCGDQAAEWALSWNSLDLRLGTVGGSRVTFSRNLSDYEPLCRPHHRERDRSPESRTKRAALEAAREVHP